MQKALKTLHADICSYIAKYGRNISSSRMTTPFLKLFSVHLPRPPLSDCTRRSPRQIEPVFASATLLEVWKGAVVAKFMSHNKKIGLKCTNNGKWIWKNFHCFVPATVDIIHCIVYMYRCAVCVIRPPTPPRIPSPDRLQLLLPLSQPMTSYAIMPGVKLLGVWPGGAENYASSKQSALRCPCVSIVLP